MTALVVSPDYASHYLPLSAVGRALQARGLDVVVATGPTLERRVRADGFEHRTLVLGSGSNAGLIRPDQQSREEAAQLTAFLQATRRGAVATLRHQAEHRLRDLLWQPAAVTERLAHIVDELRPRLVLSDQLAFGASLALRALEQPFATLLPGHPSALPSAGELFGLPPRFPPVIAVDARELAGLRALCAEVEARFAAEFGRVLRRLNPSATPPPRPFAEGGSTATLINYPSQLSPRRPRAAATFLGACSRQERLDRDLSAELASLPRPRAYVSLGTFLSEREDILARIAAGLDREGLSLVLAAGVAEPEALGIDLERHVVRPWLPQVAVLPQCDLAVSHGGNNSVTETLSAGLPLLVAPLATDQFAGAEDVRRARLGDAFDPNAAAPQEIARRARSVLAGPAPARAARLGRTLRARPGQELAADLLLARQGAAAAA